MIALSLEIYQGGWLNDVCGKKGLEMPENDKTMDGIIYLQGAILEGLKIYSL